MATVTKQGNSIAIKCPFFDRRIAQAPTKKKQGDVYYLPMTTETAKFVLRNYVPMKEIDEVTCDELEALLEEQRKNYARNFPAWFRFKNEPMSQQEEALHRSYGKNNYALFMEMGTGKTFVTINWAACLAMEGKAEALLVVCPTSVKPVWPSEIKAHCPIDTDVRVLESGDKTIDQWIKTPADGMKVLVVGVEALSQGKGYEHAITFVTRWKSAMAVDESSRIKTPDSTRTKRCINLGDACVARIIMTGTPITQGMEDIFAQFRFLDWRIIGMKSFFAFRNRYCVMGGFEGRAIVGYQNADELMERVSENTFICKKSEVLDLPPKVYETITVQPNKDQKKVLKELGDKYLMASSIIADQQDLQLECETVLERMTRYQQVVGGLFPYDKEDGTHGVVRIPGKNPKLEALAELIDDIPDDAKVIIWARFKEEQKMIAEHLGPNLAWYSADSSTADRTRMIEEFQDPLSEIRFFLSNPTMGGIGLTLTAASYMVYYSNSFSLEDRLQSEDRAHRKGQTKSVTYVDIMMNHQIDKDIITALKKKKSVADYVEEQIKEAQ